LCRQKSASFFRAILKQGCQIFHGT
jgi:hypothetical protein